MQDVKGHVKERCDELVPGTMYEALNYVFEFLENFEVFLPFLHVLKSGLF
jgi:hypothetical protein